MSILDDYLHQVEHEYRSGIAAEHAYRPALEFLLEAFDDSLNAVNDPRRTEIGAPDFVVLRDNRVPIGIAEAKDIGVDLSRIERTDQMRRYLKMGNVILTNYLEFRWYVDGEHRWTVRVATVDGGRIYSDSTQFAELESLLRGFGTQAASMVRSARELAERLAGLAQEIKLLIENDLNSDDPSSQLVGQMDAFKKTLLPALDEARFADMYAQTIAYGLFAARVGYVGDDFSRQGAARYIPSTNPFLRKLFHNLEFDLGERVTWLVDSLAELLARADMGTILEGFGQRTKQEDPVVHFYETFLSAYNPELREQRGVYYTPEPVVGYIVRSADHILKTHFRRTDGLVDVNTMILDPATGTGTFLYFVIQHIYEQLVEIGGQKGTWSEYVRDHLLPRIFGLELLMAPYTVAHMKLGLQLSETSYDFADNQRLGIYLTNTLEEARKSSESLFAQFISEEANEAAAIKREKPIMVVLGNPPYSGHSTNIGEWISGLVRDYYHVDGSPLGERNPKWLQDDYVKFIRFGQWRIQHTGSGVLAFITNHGYLDNPTFRGMRQQLLESFTSIYVLDLHGNSIKREVSPDGLPDENVFDIQPGVAIGIFVKEQGKLGPAEVNYFDLWGRRGVKYSWLEHHDVRDTEWVSVDSQSPFYLFVPQDVALRGEYEQAWKITDVMPVNNMGYQTHRDAVAVGFSDDELERQIFEYLGELPDAVRDTIYRSQYRLFDVRYACFSTLVNDRPRPALLPHVLRDNLILGVGKQGQSVNADYWQVVMCAESHVDANVFRRGGVNLFPVYLYPELRGEQLFELEDDGSMWPVSEKGRRPNLNPDFVDEMADKLDMDFVSDGRGDLELSFGVEDIFNYAYAIFHSPTYRARYAEFLKLDFPRLPLTSDRDLFCVLCDYGAELVDLHLMKSLTLGQLMTGFRIEGNNEVVAHGNYPKYDDENQYVYINGTQYFEGVPESIWEFYIGGYQVLHKWLKDRRGRKLDFNDVRHYQRIVKVLAETDRIMGEIDRSITVWPVT